MFADEKGEVRICPKCLRVHDIRRTTACQCACGQMVYSKEYDKERWIETLNTGD